MFVNSSIFTLGMAGTLGIMLSNDRPRLEELVRIEDANFKGHPLHHPMRAFQEVARGTWPQAVFVGARMEGELVGFCSGSRLTGHLAFQPGIRQTLTSDLDAQGIVYIEYFQLMPQTHSVGVGKAMLGRFIEAAQQAGFSHVAGHFREGPAYGLAQKLLSGKVMEMRIDDYFSSGETFHYVVARI